MQEGVNPISALPIQEEPVFILKASQIREIISQALLEAQGSTISRGDDRYILRDDFEALKNDYTAYREMAERDRALDRQRLARLEHPDKDPGQTDTARVQRLIKYMKARPDHRATFATLRGVLQVDASKLRAVIKAADKLDPGRFEVKDDEHDKRKSWLFAKR
jgi:hypothetical protein